MNFFVLASFDEPPNDLPPPPPESPPPESDDEDSKKSVIDAEEVKASVEVEKEEKSSPPVSPPGEYVFKYDPELQSFEGAKVEKDDNSVKDDHEIEVVKEDLPLEHPRK